MKQFDVLCVTTDTGRTDRWEVRKGVCDSFSYDDSKLIVTKNGAIVGVYSLAHLVSAVVE